MAVGTRLRVTGEVPLLTSPVHAAPLLLTNLVYIGVSFL